MSEERTKLLTIYLPADMGLMVDVMKLLTPLYPDDAKWSDCQESDGDQITFYAP